MPVPIHTPRINNNDDVVRLTQLFVDVGAWVRQGEPVAEIETDKASFTVESEQDGYLLGYNWQKGQMIDVGSILAWMGESPGELLPATLSPQSVSEVSLSGASNSPTLKATILLARYGVSASEIAARGERLSASDVERHVALRKPGLTTPAAARDLTWPMPSEPGKPVTLTPHERGMLRTVLWQKSEAVPAYVEVSYDPGPWAQYAAAFQKEHRLLISPLLPLFAWHLVRIAVSEPNINATIGGNERHVYDHVNLGFTVQSGSNLYVVVAREAETMESAAFVRSLGQLQRSAMRNELKPGEVSGATIGFSSMARWPVTRHVPVLLSHTALMIAHAAPVGGAACLGATYDHRALTGADVVRILQTLAYPPETEYNS